MVKEVSTEIAAVSKLLQLVLNVMVAFLKG